MGDKIITTIAWDGKLLASDSRITSESNIISDNFKKLYSFEDVSYLGDKILAIGMSGSASDYDKLAHMLCDNVFGHIETINNTEISAIIVGKHYVYELMPQFSYFLRYTKDTKLAIGSGESFARAAMYMNKNAIQALKLAIQLDCNSGGKVQHMRFD